MLDILKMLLGFAPDDVDEERDKKLDWILQSSQERLKVLLGGLEVPECLNHIVVEVSVMRYNRIGSEGLSSHTVEGESQSFGGNDFSGFMDEINAFLSSQQEVKKGRVRFL